MRTVILTAYRTIRLTDGKGMMVTVRPVFQVTVGVRPRRVGQVLAVQTYVRSAKVTRKKRKAK